MLQIAQQLIAKFEQLVGSAAARKFTWQRVRFTALPVCDVLDVSADELRAEIKVVDIDLTASRSAMTASKTQVES